MIAAAEIGGDEFPEDGSMPASNHGEHHYASVSEPHRHRYSGYCFRFSIALNLALILCSIFMSILFYRIADRNTLSKAPNEATNPFPEINWRPLPGKDQVISRVAFGSCSSQRMPQPYWDTVTMFEPDILVLMGDNVYGDCDPLDFHLNNTAVDPIALKKACAPLEQAYRDMASHPSVQGAASLIPVFATLDDHDYGISDATILNPFKDVARQLFRDFFNINDLPSDGVYRSKSWGPAGRRLQIILLDTRYSRSPFLSTGDPNAPFKPYPDNLRNSSTNIDNSSAESKRMLSEEQWIWFEEQLSQPADLRLVISSVQVLASVSPFECWRHIPSEQGRLIQLIQNKSALVLSGDRKLSWPEPFLMVSSYWSSGNSIIHF